MKKKKIRVALFNNLNNSNFSVARHLRDRGYEVTLFLMNEFEHFMPINDTYDENDLKMVQTLDWYDRGFWTSNKEIKKVASEHDFLIGTGVIPAYMFKAGINLDLLFPMGGEIRSQSFFSWDKKKSIISQLGLYYAKYYLRKGLRRTKKVAIPYYDDAFEGFIKKLGLFHNRSFDIVPFIYIPQYQTDSFIEYSQANELYRKISKIKAETDLLIIQQGRQEISDPANLDYKGNDKLFKAFKQIIEVNNINAHLVLFEHGTDIALSKKLIQELEIKKHVTWLPLTPRKDIMPVLSLADVGVGILSDVSFITYGSLLELLVMNIPVIHHYAEEKIKNIHFETMYPYINARTEKEVYEALLSVYNDKEKYKKIASTGRGWVQKNIIDSSLDMIERMIVDKQTKNK
jgi:hypothetical protein